jgi:hypothetical protein
LPDAFAIALAKTHDWALLAGDGALRKLAGSERLRCHGVLWVFDQFHDTGIPDPATLHRALTVISAHPRCRLPQREVKQRLEKYAALLPTPRK